MTYQLHWQDFSRWAPFREMPKPPVSVRNFATQAEAEAAKDQLAYNLDVAPEHIVACVKPASAHSPKETAASRRASLDALGFPEMPKRLTR